MEEGKLKKKRGPASNRLVETKEVYRDGKPGSGKYQGPDKIAVKHKLTEKQKAFVDEYLLSKNQSAAYRAAKGTLDKPEERMDSDRSNGSIMRRLDKVKAYLMEKIMTDAAECLDIQMDLIRNDKTPAAVRNAAIADRLNRMGLGKEKQESTEFTGIGEVTITIKHKKPEVIDMDNEVEMVEGEVLDTKEDNEQTV